MEKELFAPKLSDGSPKRSVFILSCYFPHLLFYCSSDQTSPSSTQIWGFASSVGLTVEVTRGQVLLFNDRLTCGYNLVHFKESPVAFFTKRIYKKDILITSVNQ